MPNQLADAQNNLANWENTYHRIRDNHARLEPVAFEAAKEGEDDENGSVNPAAITVISEHGKMAVSLDALLTSALRTFDNYLGISPTNSRDVFLSELYKKMSADQSNLQVKSRGTVYGASAAGGSNVGNSVLYVCSKDRNNDVIESATIETLTFRAAGAAGSRNSLGLETWSIRGAGKSARSEFSAEGVGTQFGGHTALGPGRSTIVGNASFDLAFSGTGTSKIQAFEIISGDSNIARDTSVYAEDRGDTPASLKITGNCKFRFYFRKQNVNLSYLAPYIFGFRWKADGSNGTITARLGSSGTSYTKAQATSNTGFATVSSDPDTANAWRKNFDTDGNPFLEFEVSSYVSGNIWLDDIFCDAMDFGAGRFYQIVSGVTPTVEGDTHTQACTLTVGSGSVALTGGASGSIDTITVGGVSILSAAIPFNTSLAQTAQDAVDNINANKTYPQYYAERSSNTIIIKQVFPVAGTITVASTVTTITKTDTDITGAAIGLKQDALVRRTGQYLPHASSASSGWGDHA